MAVREAASTSPWMVATAGRNSKGAFPNIPWVRPRWMWLASNPNRVYALIEDADPGLYRSDDGGKTWKLMNNSHDMLERPAYYTRMRIAPDDEDRVYFQSVVWSMTSRRRQDDGAPLPAGGLGTSTTCGSIPKCRSE